MQGLSPQIFIPTLVFLTSCALTALQEFDESVVNVRLHYRFVACLWNLNVTAHAERFHPLFRDRVRISEIRVSKVYLV